MKRTRKGFTLVELLIVVAIIGVLAAMMTLSSADATVAAKAASIANGYKIIGTAFTVYHAISGDDSTAKFFTNHSNDYVGPQVKNLGGYTVSSTDLKCYVAYGFKRSGEDAVKNKFMTYSKDMGMEGSSYKMRIY